MKKTLSIAAAVTGLGLLTSGVNADTMTLDFDIQNGVGDGFAYSLIHTSTPENPMGGSLLYRMTGTFQIVFDDLINTLTFTEFDATLHSKPKASKPDKLGKDVGAITLDSGELKWDPDSGIASGLLTVNMEVKDEVETVTFQFDPMGYNPYANRYDPDTQTLALWGATPFEQTARAKCVKGLGMDLAGTGTQVVPLPAPVALGLAGLGGVLLRRRMTA